MAVARLNPPAGSSQTPPSDKKVWGVLYDWLFQLWKSVTNGTFGTDSSSYSQAIAMTAGVSDPGQIGILLSTGTNWQTYTPTLSALAGSYTTASATGAYYLNGKMCHVIINIVITTVGTGTYPVVGLPFPVSGVVNWVDLTGRDNGSSAKMVHGFGATSPLTVTNYDNTVPVASGSNIAIGGTYITS
jgi:hypothetical protein